MKLKLVILSSLVVARSVVLASEFTLPKAGNTGAAVSARKTKEAILEQMGDALEQLTKLDRASIDLRVDLQSEVKNGLCGDEAALTSSSSKARLQTNLDLVQELNKALAELADQLKSWQHKIKKLKTEKLKG